MNAITPQIRRPDAPLSCKASAWLETSQVREDTLPQWLVPEIPRLMREAEASLKPATERDFAVAMDQLLEFAALYELPAKGQASLVTLYRRSLADVPADVLMQAIADTLRDWSFRKLPLPGDIRKHANAEIARRQQIKLRANHARIVARTLPQPEPPTTPYRDMPPDQKAKVDAMIEGLKQGFRWYDPLADPLVADHPAFMKRGAVA